jgi:hypothetical protein
VPSQYFQDCRHLLYKMPLSLHDGTTPGSGTAYTSGAPGFTPGF